MNLAPESVSTAKDSRSKRPLKKRAITPRDTQAEELAALFAKPEREIEIPPVTAAKKALPPPPEIIANVQGSSAGAGSGEFHVYKASRRREYERIRQMEEEVEQEQAQKEFEEKKAEMEKKDRERTERNRLKRQKAKERKEKALKEKKAANQGVNQGEQNDNEGGEVKKLAPKSVDAKKDEPEENVSMANGDGNTVEEVGIIIHDDD
jgi:hypothetical protein